MGSALSMATSFAASVAIGYFAGNYLDKKFGTEPYLMLILLLLGLATGLKIMYDQAFGDGINHKDGEDEENGDTRKYAPSREIITALDEAKKMVADLDKSESKSKD